MKRTLATMLLTIVFLAGAAHAATVTVTIVDTNDDPIEGAKARVADAVRHLDIGATADEAGHAVLEDLPEGTLLLKFSAKGFERRELLVTTSVIGDELTVRLAEDRDG